MPWKETCRMDEKLVFVGLSAWRVADNSALRGLRHQPQDGLQMARSLSRARPGGLGGALSCAAPSWSVDGAGDGRSDCCSAQAASPLGSAQAARSADGRAPRGGVACGQHDGRSAACGRAGELAPPAPSSCCRARAALPCRHRAQRCVVHRLQGLVPHPRRRTLRPADRQRRLQPFPSGLCHRPAPDRHGPCGGRAALQALRPASGHPLGQRGTVRRNGRGRTVSSVGRLDQGRHRVGAHRAGPAPAERTARAHASDLEGRDGQTAGRECGPAAGPLRPLPPGLSTTTVPTRRLASSRLRRSTGPRCGLTPNAWTSPGTMPGTPCAGCAPTGPSSGAATWSSSARR